MGQACGHTQHVFTNYGRQKYESWIWHHMNIEWVIISLDISNSVSTFGMQVRCNKISYENKWSRNGFC